MAHRTSEALFTSAVPNDGATFVSADTTRRSGGARRQLELNDTLRDTNQVIAGCAHFDIERLIGRGGMGLVYRAWDRVLRRHVALKILPDIVAEAPADRDRILDEARAQARLSSPHVVHVHYVGRARHPENPSVQSSFFAMELCEGGTLDDLLERGECLQPPQARAYMAAVSRGLRDALAAGIVHRDIKPRNLLLDERGRVRIADFGVARRVDQNGGLTWTRSGRAVGTPLYMAPEQARGEATDHRADIYSLGCSFYHLLAGRPPFTGSNSVQILQGHLRDSPPRLREVAPDVPAPLARIIDRMLEKEPDHRFQSYEQLLAALTEAGKPRPRAGIGVRAAAAAVDLAIALLAIVFLGWWGVVLHFVMVTAGHAFFGQTPGKWLMSIEARSSDGGPLGLAAAVRRTLTSIWLPILVATSLAASAGADGLVIVLEQLQNQDLPGFARSLVGLMLGHSLLCMLYCSGLAIALLDSRKRTVHDLIARSEVVQRPS